MATYAIALSVANLVFFLLMDYMRGKVDKAQMDWAESVNTALKQQAEINMGLASILLQMENQTQASSPQSQQSGSNDS